METPQEIIRLVINKSIVPGQRRRRGRTGYGIVLIVRLLVYMMLARVLTDKGLIRHLRKHPRIAKGLGFKTIPHRTTIGRWRKQYGNTLRQVFEEIADLICKSVPTKIEIVDSTPLEDEDDPDARVGFTSRGAFRGFKAHLGVNQIGAALRAKVTTGNEHDSPHMPDLIVKSEYILGDAGYDAESNREAINALDAVPVIAINPRNTKHKKPRKCRHKELLKRKRYIVEQFNALLKEVLSECWRQFRGLEAKYSVVYSALIAININVLWSLLIGAENLREISRFWY